MWNNRVNIPVSKRNIKKLNEKSHNYNKLLTNYRQNVIHSHPAVKYGRQTGVGDTREHIKIFIFAFST